MGFSTTTLLSVLALTSTTGWARYTLQQDFMQGGNFLDQFSFWDTADPTNGFVQYLSQPDAEMAGMINQTGSQITLAADSTETTTTGRKSIRITSNLSFQSGLVILDLAHMPGSICGSWPAFWTVGPNWPNEGEIDIIEGVNTNTMNAMTLHTGEGCTINNSGSGGTSDIFTGTVSTSNCDINAADQPTNAGCSIDATSSNTYGSGFNNAGGGVYAMELTSNGIAIYFFSRNSIPSDISSDSPDPSTWGTPISSFQGDCDFASKFTNQQIVFDTTFCGDWAGAVWPSSTCAAQFGSSCENFVGQNPSAFAESYWTINSLRLFQNNGAGGGASSAPSGSPAQTTFATATPGWPSGGSSPTSGAPPGGFSPPPGGGHGHGHHHFHGSGAPPGFTPHDGSVPPQVTPTTAQGSSVPGFTPHDGSVPPQVTPTTAPASSPAQASSPPAQTSSPAQTASSASQQSPQPPASSPAPPQGGSPPRNNGGGSSDGPSAYSAPPAYSTQGNVEAMTVSVSQKVPGSTAAATTAEASPSPSPSGPVLAAEHSQGAGVYGVVNPLRRDRERHLRMHHKGRRGARI